MKPISILPESETPPPLPDRPWMTVDEAVLLFHTLGLPRTPEAIRGYCRKGRIEATTMEGAKGEQHMIRTESARAFINERRQVLDALGQNLPEHGGTFRKLPVRSVTFRDDPDLAAVADLAGPRAAEKALEARHESQRVELEALRHENRTLEIDKRVREQMLERVDADRQLLLGRVLEMGTEVGQLRERLAMLQPGRFTPVSVLRAERDESQEPAHWQGAGAMGDNPIRQ